MQLQTGIAPPSMPHRSSLVDSGMLCPYIMCICVQGEISGQGCTGRQAAWREVWSSLVRGPQEQG